MNEFHAQQDPLRERKEPQREGRKEVWEEGVSRPRKGEYKITTVK